MLLKLRTAEAIVLSLAIFAVVPFLETHPVQADTYQSHLEIDISGNTGFTSANGVVSGTGTASSPFVIKGWSITSQCCIAIYVHNTNAYFIIEDVDVCSGVNDGIDLENVTHGVVQQSQFPDCSGYSGNTSSIRVLGSKDVTIANNTLEAEYASLYHSSNLKISGNTFNGILMKNTGPRASPTWISVEHSNDSIFSGNNLFGAILQMTSSQRNLVYRNNFLRRCTYYTCDGNMFGAALDDQPGQNSWDNGYPSGGNYWVNYTASDRCSGFNQDVCNGPDGILDTPYHFRNETDKYPLKDAIADQAPPNWTSSKTLIAWDIGQTSLRLAWSWASDDLGVTGYRVYGNGAILASLGRDNATNSITYLGPGTMYTSNITGLNPGTTYTFYIVAVDVANTTSVDGPSLNVNMHPFWWQIDSAVWWQSNWVWLIIVVTPIAAVSLIAAFDRRRSRRQKKLTEFA